MKEQFEHHKSHDSEMASKQNLIAMLDRQWATLDIQERQAWKAKADQMNLSNVYHALPPELAEVLAEEDYQDDGEDLKPAAQPRAALADETETTAV